MKTKLFFLSALLLPMLASAQTESDVQNSGCLYENETQEEEGQSVQSIVLTKEGSTLSVQLLNYESNCGTTDFSVTPYVNSSSGHYWVSINVEPVVPAAMNCICPFNISFTIHDFEPNNFDFYCWWYNKNVELTDGEPFVMAKIDDICYYLFSSTNEAKVIDYNYTGDIEIPETVVYNGTEYRVTAITDNAFVGSKGLTSVHFPNSLQSIGTNAFQSCSNLTSVTIPNSVTNIHNHAFWNCTGLTTVSFESNSSLKTIGMFAFGDCTSLKSFTIPNSVTEIGSYAFRNCGKLTSITIPNSVTEIGEAALQGCNGLISIVVEKENKVYDSREGCNAIIKTSENELLVGCRTTTIPNDVSAIGNYAFFGCTNLRSITLPNSLTTIGNSSFEGCTDLRSFDIPNNVTAIGGRAFFDCRSLRSINIPNGVTTIEDMTFAGCDHLSSIIIPNGVTTIGNGAFLGCKRLASIDIPNSVTLIGPFSFSDCSGLTSVTIPNSVTKIGGNAFSYCNSLTSISIPNSVTEIGSDAFFRCSGLTSVTIPNSVTSIGAAAFRRCENLTSITIGNKVNYIGHQAFEECHKFMDVYCYAENVPKTENTIFFNSNIENATLHVPAASLGTYQATEPWSSFKEIVALADQMAYHPLVVEGKEWRYTKESDGQQDGKGYVSLVIRGDTVINGTAYKKLLFEDDGETTYWAAVRESDRKIDFISYGSDAVVHYYDFNLHYGDLIEHNGSTYKLLDEQYVDVSGGQFRVMELWHEMSGGKYVSSDIWIEGIGNLSGLLDVTGNWFPFVFPMGSGMGQFTSCYESGRCIFSVEEYMKQRVAFIKGITTKGSDGYTYDLQGRKLSNSKWSNGQIRKGIYIKDGRKFVVK